MRRLREACSRLSRVDLGFAALRALVAAGGLVWLLLAPLSARLLNFFSWRVPVELGVTMVTGLGSSMTNATGLRLSSGLRKSPSRK